mmetsp:Transcript_18836/g.38066  ORF Transcript_18836/g.38066 Transcript_18836/m.38066 type:complete len:101 (+) Transcript_18836:3134-3436(+)
MEGEEKELRKKCQELKRAEEKIKAMEEDERRKLDSNDHDHSTRRALLRGRRDPEDEKGHKKKKTGCGPRGPRGMCLGCAFMPAVSDGRDDDDYVDDWGDP